ncbi:hypothetical protein TNCV_4991381 [Trichonephila clavipes]|nr:hypothetical protein TNCV_4991381 [Trichonephila clavipes]
MSGNRFSGMMNQDSTSTNRMAEFEFLAFPEERLLPECIVPTVKVGGGVIIVYGCFSWYGIESLIPIHGYNNHPKSVKGLSCPSQAEKKNTTVRHQKFGKSLPRSVKTIIPLRGSPSLGESQIFTNVWRSIARFDSCAIKSDIHSFIHKAVIASGDVLEMDSGAISNESTTSKKETTKEFDAHKKIRSTIE